MLEPYLARLPVARVHVKAGFDLGALLCDPRADAVHVVLDIDAVGDGARLDAREELPRKWTAE